MKDFIGEYSKMIMYTIFGLLLIIASYSIILNIYHMKSLSLDVFVSEIDTNYINLKNNINRIDNILDHYQENNDNTLYLTINYVMTSLKNDGVFRLMPNSKISYQELYSLNDYFMETLINNCWVSHLKQINKDSSLEEMVKLLINDTNYMRTILVNNSLTLSEARGNDLINNDYQFILKNYERFSYVVLEISKTLGGSYE